MQMMETPLIRCAHNGHFQTVKFLVEQRADVNALDLVRIPRLQCMPSFSCAFAFVMCSKEGDIDRHTTLKSIRGPLPHSWNCTGGLV